MKDQITINGRDGAFGAYIARPDALPAPAVVVLHEVFGVNACHPTSSPPKPKKEASR
jgi:carboxymethylenebutenolidase